MTRPPHRAATFDRPVPAMAGPRRRAGLLLLTGMVACLAAGCAKQMNEHYQPDEGVPIEILIIDPVMIGAPGQATVTFGYEAKTKDKLPNPPVKQWVSLFVQGGHKKLLMKPDQWHAFDQQTLTRTVTIPTSDYAVGKSGTVTIMVRAQDTTKELEKPLAIDGTTPEPPP